MAKYPIIFKEIERDISHLALLMEFCKTDESGNFFWEGSLDEFFEQYNRNFCVSVNESPKIMVSKKDFKK